MRPAGWFMPVPRQRLVWLEVIRTFPAKLLPEKSTQIAQAIIGGREAQVASGHAFFTRVVDIVILRVGLDGARHGIVLAGVVRTKAAHVQPPHIPLRMAGDDPLGHDLTDAARASQAVGAEGTRHPETLNRRRS